MRDIKYEKLAYFPDIVLQQPTENKIMSIRKSRCYPVVAIKSLNQKIGKHHK